MATRRELLLARAKELGLDTTGVKPEVSRRRELLLARAKELGLDTSSVQPETQQSSGFPGASLAEPLAALATGAFAEPIAGIAGIAQSLNPFAKEGAGERAVAATREALTFQPRTEAGQEALQGVGEFVAPVTEKLSQAEEFLGDKTFEATGSPTLAAAAQSFPTLIGELIGVAIPKAAVGSVKRAAKGVESKQVAAALDEATPTIDQLKDTARSIYKELDESDITIKQNSYNKLVNSIEKDLIGSGLDRTITPKAQAALGRLQELQGRTPTLSQLDTLRTVAKGGAGSLEKTEQALSMKITNKIDKFLDTGGAQVLQGPEDAVKNVGRKYKAARGLWGRARRSELIDDALETAETTASGFENGIRQEFRRLLRNKKTKNMFNAKEKAEIQSAIDGTRSANLAKRVGKLGFGDRGSSNFLGASIGVAGGAQFLGPVGAVLSPIIGGVSKKLANKLTKEGAESTKQFIAAGRDADKITRAYMKNVKKADRSIDDLQELLLNPEIDVSKLKTGLPGEAAKKVKAARILMLSGALGAGTQSPTVVGDETSQ